MAATILPVGKDAHQRLGAPSWGRVDVGLKGRIATASVTLADEDFASELQHLCQHNLDLLSAWCAHKQTGCSYTNMHTDGTATCSGDVEHKLNTRLLVFDVVRSPA
jgi:hypothetical protein